MLCQSVCPLNREQLRYIKESFTFSEPETDEILSNLPDYELSESTVQELTSLNLYEDYHLLGRNLEILIRQKNE